MSADILNLTSRLARSPYGAAVDRSTEYLALAMRFVPCSSEVLKDILYRTEAAMR